jgi:hypothetical protein
MRSPRKQKGQVVRIEQELPAGNTALQGGGSKGPPWLWYEWTMPL